MYKNPTLFKQKWLLLMAAGLYLISTSMANAAVIYVNSTASGANTGASWADAYISLQSALAAANTGDVVWVARGVYKPSVAIDFDGDGLAEAREATFRIKSGVKVYGGFAGGEATLAERNVALNLTILSGDIDHNDLNADGNAIAESTDHLMGNNAFHVVYTANVSPVTLVDGFVITAGNAYKMGLPSNTPNMNGGGWYNQLVAPAYTSSPGIANCTFQGNYAGTNGGAWYSLPGPEGAPGATCAPVFTACKFYTNKANFSGGAVFIGSFRLGTYAPIFTDNEFSGNRALRYGGAVYLYGDGSTFTSCTFTDNAVTVISPDGGTLPGSGGAVNLVSSTTTSFTDCMFIGNKATGTPNGVFEGGGGGAVHMASSETNVTTFGMATYTFEGCGFYNNTASDNTGAWGGATLHKSDTGKMKASYTNCVFAGNHAQNEGGATGSYVRILGSPETFTPGLQTDFTNCTFTANTADSRGGGLYFNKSNGETNTLTARVENSIVYGNTAPSGPQIGNTGFAGPVLAHTLIQGGFDASVGVDGGNNIGGDPLFINAADLDGADNTPGTTDDGLRLSAGSPAINSGNSAAAGLLGITTDFAGEARIQGGTVDRGAYESTSIYIPPIPIIYYWLRDWNKPTPGCLSCPWGIRLQDKAIVLNPRQKLKGILQNFEWKSNAQLAIHSGYAIVTGRIASQENPSIQFDVYLKLVEQSSWETWAAQNRSYSAVTPAAKQVADQNFQHWTYWVLSEESYLTGKAAIEGTLQLTHWPAGKATGFQLGQGANDHDGDFGLNGEFAYAGTLYYKKQKLALSGIGSLNADAILCTQDCLVNTEVMARKDFSDENSGSNSAQPSYLLYPNPVHTLLTVEVANPRQGLYVFTLYDLKGQRVNQYSTHLQNSHITLDTGKLTPGIYRLEIQSPDGSLHYHKVIRY